MINIQEFFWDNQSPVFERNRLVIIFTGGIKSTDGTKIFID
jgi:hypothetical protein